MRLWSDAGSRRLGPKQRSALSFWNQRLKNQTARAPAKREPAGFRRPAGFPHVTQTCRPPPGSRTSTACLRRRAPGRGEWPPQSRRIPSRWAGRGKGEAGAQSLAPAAADGAPAGWLAAPDMRALAGWPWAGAPLSVVVWRHGLTVHGAVQWRSSV